MDQPAVVVYDACVLYPAPLRDLLMWLANNGLVKARWSEQILGEWLENLLRNRPDLQRERLTRTCSEMNRALPDALVSGYESRIENLSLPDPNDRHVLAAALTAGAQLILTANLRDFPEAQMPIGIRAVAPDEFLTQLFESQKDAFLETMREHRDSLQRPTKTAEEYLATLATNGLVGLVQKVLPVVDQI